MLLCEQASLEPSTEAEPGTEAEPAMEAEPGTEAEPAMETDSHTGASESQTDASEATSTYQVQFSAVCCSL